MRAWLLLVNSTNSSLVEIGEADRCDIPALVALLTELFTLESDFLPDPEKQAQGLALLIGCPIYGRVFVMRFQGTVVGMVNALFTISTAEGGPVILMEDVILDTRYRGQGLGRRLIEYVIRWANAEGYLRVTVLADHTNEGALHFYQRLGFRRSSMVVNRLEINGECT